MKKRSMPVFCRTLKSLMDKRKISVRKLSEMTVKKGYRVPSSSISEWRTGVLATDYKALKVISQCLNVSMEYLLTGEVGEEPEFDIEDVFTEGDEVYNGIARVKVVQLIPKSKKKI